MQYNKHLTYSYANDVCTIMYDCLVCCYVIKWDLLISGKVFGLSSRVLCKPALRLDIYTILGYLHYNT